MIEKIYIRNGYSSLAIDKLRLLRWTGILKPPFHWLLIFEDVQGYKDSLDGSFCSIQLSFNSIAVTFCLRDSHMSKLSRWMQCDTVADYIDIFYYSWGNTFVYYKNSCSIHTSYSPLKDASVNPEFNSFTSFTHMLKNML